MSFTLNTDLPAIMRMLSAPTLGDKDLSILLSAANSTLDGIYNYSAHTFKSFKSQTTLTAISGQSYIDISTITDFSKCIDLYYDEIKPENRLYPTSANFLNKFLAESELDDVDNDNDISQIDFNINNSGRPFHYTTEFLPNRIYFDGEFSNAESLIMIYKKSYTNITTLTETIPLSDSFRWAFFNGLIEFLIQPTNNIQKFNINYYKDLKESKLNDIMQEETGKETKKTGKNINKELLNLSDMSKI